MPSEAAQKLRRRVASALDGLRPALVQDGGNCELVSVTEDGTVHLEFQGACATCPAQAATLRLALEPALRRAAPGVVAIVPVVRDASEPTAG